MAFRDERVFITGGAGFIGRVWTRAHPEVRTLTILGRDEARLLQAKAKAPWIHTVRSDVTVDHSILAQYLNGHNLLIHAAATKHVDRCEYAPLDSVRINVDGTRNMALAAIEAGVEVALLISTDKAVFPANVYGATKMLAERIWHEASTWGSRTRFVVCRYGNVIASTGSVLPKVRAQARAGLPLTVTNPGMTRFWLSPQDALDLVDMAITLPNGLVLVPQPGASTIRTALEAAIGCGLDDYIHGVTYITRPGEKDSELMFTDAEHVAAVGAEYRDLRGAFAFEPLGAGRESLGLTYASSADPQFWWTREAIADAIAEAELI